MCVCWVIHLCPTLWHFGLKPTRLLCPWNFPGKNTGLDCHSLLQGNFLIQGSNPHPVLPALQVDSFTTESSGKPHLIYNVVQSPSHVWFFATTWSEAHKMSLSLTIFWSLPQFMSIAPMISSSHLILWCPLQFSSVQSSSHVQLFATPWNTACQVSLTITISHSLLKLMSVASVMPSNHLIFCHPLLLLPSMYPSIRLFSNEFILQIRCPKYWSFSFNISLFNDYSGLILLGLTGWISAV